MGRSRRGGNETGINLSSFLNIMTATIGVQALLLVIFALQIKPGVQSIRLLPAGGEGRGREANYILCNGQGKLELIGDGKKARSISKVLSLYHFWTGLNQRLGLSTSSLGCGQMHLVILRLSDLKQKQGDF